VIKSLLDCPLLISSQYGPFETTCSFQIQAFFVQQSYECNVASSSNFILTSNPQPKTINGELSNSANLNKVVIEFLKRKTMCKLHRKFQDEWVCKLP
jgi:hypothetical protein